MKPTNFVTSLLHNTDSECPQGDKSAHDEHRFIFSKLIFALNHLRYTSREFWLNPETDDSGVLLCAEDEFWGVSLVESGVRTPSALFFEIEDALEFFLKKLSGGEVTLEVIDAVAADNWATCEPQKIQRGLYSSYRSDSLSLVDQESSCTQLTPPQIHMTSA